MSSSPGREPVGSLSDALQVVFRGLRVCGLLVGFVAVCVSECVSECVSVSALRPACALMARWFLSVESGLPLGQKPAFA